MYHTLGGSILPPLHRLQSAKRLTKVDVRSGYHLISFATKNFSHIAFWTGSGSFQHKVVPFGLTKALATFQALMNPTFANCMAPCSLQK